MTSSTEHNLVKKIELWNIDKLVPYDKNPRTHSDEQVGKIAASMARFGFVNPILVDTKAGIIAGHGRLQAAKQLGMQEVPVIILDHLTEEEKRAYVIADNQLALDAGWDDALLSGKCASMVQASAEHGVSCTLALTRRRKIF